MKELLYFVTLALGQTVFGFGHGTITISNADEQGDCGINRHGLLRLLGNGPLHYNVIFRPAGELITLFSQGVHGHIEIKSALISPVRARYGSHYLAEELHLSIGKYHV